MPIAPLRHISKHLQHNLQYSGDSIAIWSLQGKNSCGAYIGTYPTFRTLIPTVIYFDLGP